MKIALESCLKRQHSSQFDPLFDTLTTCEEVFFSGGMSLRDLASPTSLFPPEPTPSSPPSPEEIIVAKGAHGERITLRHLMNYLSTLGLA
ncbi:MAG: hypothetical protein Kow00121_13890 [Elainellaceae cyanobacterium]